MDKTDLDQKIKELCEIKDDEEVLNELRQVSEEDVYRLQNEQMFFYEPNGKCEEFIKKVGEGSNFVILFSAANGVGKTCAGANIVANII